MSETILAEATEQIKEPVAQQSAEETKPAPVENAAKPAETEPKKSSIISDAGKSQPTVDKDGKPIPVAEEGKENANEEKKEPEQSKPTVPEKYEVKAPEGMTLDQATLEKFTPIAKELGLSNEQVQKLVDFQANQITNAQALQKQAFESFVSETREETINYFGSKLEAELPYVAKGRDNFADDEVIQLLDATGLSNHKAFVKMFAKMGRTVSEDKLVDGNAAAPVDTRTDGQIIYSKT